MRTTQRGESGADFFFGIFFILLFVGGIIWFVGWTLFAWKPFSSEISAYPVLCAGVIKNNYCKGKVIPDDTLTFKVFDERQIVILQSSILSAPPEELRNCTVRDKHNWTCTHIHVLLGSLEMIDGELTSTLRYVSKWKWWACTFGSNLCGSGWSKK
jgi:hypothetical protein